METHLSGDVVLVSGSTAGIGKEIAREFAARGASVVVNGRSRETGDDVASSLAAETGSEVTFVPADINDYDEVVALVEATVDRFGGLDVLVANGAAGAGPPANFFRKMDPEHLEAFCTGHFVNRMYLAKAALEPMIEGDGGRMINVTTDAGRVPTPGELGPGAAGAAVMMATRILASEFNRWDIAVNAVALTVTQGTELLRALSEGSEISDVFQKAIDRQDFPLTAERVARAVAFLAADEGGRPITGQTISMTGGVSY